ncbi:MAG: tRNA guanosine(34) transglycosylase Tgt [Candidatus Binatia bacterium]|nr:tRNA guanosine(34) transglycosylase Tgt [Candidatus Binatia bacterium]
MNPVSPLFASPTPKECFRVTAQDGAARCGVLTTPHGEVSTPAFMPVATQATVKAMTPRELRVVGVQIVLANTYHLALRPGVEVVRALGGLHQFMGWSGPILTDSGGYQIYSLAPLRKVSDEGVRFRSHIDGQEVLFTPEKVINLQSDLGVDIAMVLDECPPAGAPRTLVEEATRRSLAWAERSQRVSDPDGPLVFGIVQGGVFIDIRKWHAQELVALQFPGYAVGGLSVGEERSVTRDVAAATAEELPRDRPRYLMGVGYPEDLIRFVGMGYDLFDCVLPTRNARNGLLFTSFGRLNIRLSRFQKDNDPPDPLCACYTCANFSRGYLRHLSLSKEILAATLATTHNLYFYQRLMRDMQTAITNQSFVSWAAATIPRLEQEYEP